MRQAASLTENMGLILPPLLTIMDDYETVYRDHGLECLDILLGKVNANTMKRMGIDKLFLKVRFRDPVAPFGERSDRFIGSPYNIRSLCTLRHPILRSSSTL